MNLRLLAGTFALVAMLAAGWSNSAGAEDAARLHFINVGKGDATLVEFPCGAMLIDTGKEPDKVLTYLDRFFARRTDLNNTLDLVVLTHAHGDHANGFVPVASKFTVKRALTNGRYEGKQRPALDWLSAHPDVKHDIIRQEDIPAGGLTNDVIDPFACSGTDPVIKAFWGAITKRPPGWRRKAFKDKNNHSVTVRIDYGSASTLFTGDLEVDGINAMLRKHGGKVFDVDIFKVGHHGFNSGTTPELLKDVSPELAVLSRPADRAISDTEFKLLEDAVTGTRNPLAIEIYTCPANGERADSDEDDDAEDGIKRNKKGKNRCNDKNGQKSPAKLGKSVYWTGMDGSTVVTVSPSGEYKVQTGQ